MLKLVVTHSYKYLGASLWSIRRNYKIIYTQISSENHSLSFSWKFLAILYGNNIPDLSTLSCWRQSPALLLLWSDLPPELESEMGHAYCFTWFLPTFYRNVEKSALFFGAENNVIKMQHAHGFFALLLLAQQLLLLGLYYCKSDVWKLTKCIYVNFYSTILF